MVSLQRVTDGTAPRLATSVGLYYDDDHLNLMYRAQDDEVVATYDVLTLVAKNSYVAESPSSAIASTSLAS